MPKRKEESGSCDNCSHPLSFSLQNHFCKSSVVFCSTAIVFFLFLVSSVSATPIILQHQHDQQTNSYHHQSTYFKKLGYHRRNTSRAQPNDGTAGGAGEYYQIDDMLFLNKSKRDRAGQYRDSYRWPAGRIPYTFAPGYCKLSIAFNVN